MGMELEGLSEFQKALFDTATTELPKEVPKLMRKIGSKARTKVAQQARKTVGKHKDVYHKKWKRGKVFKDSEGKWVVRVINSAPHAHLIEDGHRIIRDGREVGFSRGIKPLEKGWSNFEQADLYGAEVEKWLDKLLRDGKL